MVINGFIWGLCDLLLLTTLLLGLVAFVRATDMEGWIEQLFGFTMGVFYAEGGVCVLVLGIGGSAVGWLAFLRIAMSEAMVENMGDIASAVASIAVAIIGATVAIAVPYYSNGFGLGKEEKSSEVKILIQQIVSAQNSPHKVTEIIDNSEANKVFLPATLLVVWRTYLSADTDIRKVIRKQKKSDREFNIELS
jgi:hypothetical protein